ncbi:MAG: envelope stress response membrane protein PspC [Pseudomonadota bacterium]
MPRTSDYYTSSPNPKKFYRSRDDRVIAGICGGLAERFGWEPLVVRIAAVAGFMFMAGPLAVIAYIVTWMLTPKTPFGQRPLSDEEDTFWRGVSDRPNVTFGNLKYTFMDLEDRLQTLERNVTSDEWRLRREFRDLEGN